MQCKDKVSMRVRGEGGGMMTREIIDKHGSLLTLLRVVQASVWRLRDADRSRTYQSTWSRRLGMSWSKQSVVLRASV